MRPLVLSDTAVIFPDSFEKEGKESLPPRIGTFYSTSIITLHTRRQQRQPNSELGLFLPPPSNGKEGKKSGFTRHKKWTYQLLPLTISPHLLLRFIRNKKGQGREQNGLKLTMFLEVREIKYVLGWQNEFFSPVLVSGVRVLTAEVFGYLPRRELGLADISKVPRKVNRLA